MAEKIEGFLLRSQKELLYSLSFPLNRKDFLQSIRCFTLKDEERSPVYLVVPTQWSPLWEKLGLELFEGQFDPQTFHLKPKHARTASLVEKVESFPTLYHLIQLTPWPSEPNFRCILFLIKDYQVLTEILHESILLGKDQLSLNRVQENNQEYYLLWSEKPSYFLVQKWSDLKEKRVEIFYPLNEQSDIYLPWGFKHPLQNLLIHSENQEHQEPIEKSQKVLTVYRNTKWLNYPAQNFTDIYQFISFFIPELKPETLKKVETKDRFEIQLRMVQRDYAADPLLWRLPWEAKDRLENLLSTLAEEDLNNILICQFVDEQGARHLFIRELVVGKSRKFMDFGPYKYALFSNIKNLYLPANKSLEPDIRLTRYNELFDLKNGILTVIDELEDGQYRILKLDEFAFKSLPVLIDYLVSEHIEQLSELITQTVFDFKKINIEFEGVLENIKVKEKKASSKEDDEDLQKNTIPTNSKNLILPIPLKTKTEDKKLSNKPKTPKNKELEKLQKEEEQAEDQCISDPFSLENWRNLALTKFRFNTIPKFREAALCLENSLWLVESQESEKQIKDLLYSLLETQIKLTTGWEKTIPTILEKVKHPVDKGMWLWLILRWLRSSRPDNTQFLEVLELIKAQNNALRKKTSWLLWREIILFNNDKSEEERQRERLLGQLNRQGLHEKDTFPFVRQKLAKRFSNRRTGSGITNVLMLIDAGFKKGTRSGKRKDYSSYETIGKSYLSRGYIDIGKSEDGLNNALEIFKLKPPSSEESLFNYYKARIIAGGALLRVGQFNAEQEIKVLIEQIAHESKKAAEEEHSAASKIQITPYNLKKLILEMLRLIHYAGALQHPEITRQIFQLVETIPFQNKAFYKADILHSSEEYLGELGINEEIGQFARTLLQQSEILNDCYYFEMIFSALHKLIGEEIFTEEFAQLLLKVNYEDLSIISISHLDKAICYYGSELGEEIIAQVSKSSFPKLNYIIFMLQTCILDRLAQEGKTEEGFALFDQIFKEVFSKKLDFGDQDTKDDCRQTILKRLIDKLPGFGNVVMGVPKIKAIMENLSKFKDVGHQGEVLTRIARGLSQLGSSEEAFQILNQVLQLSKEIIEKREPHYLICFKVIDICIASLNELEEAADRCLTIVDSAYKILQAARKKIKNLNRYYLCLAEFRCGYQFAQLGEEEKGYNIIEGLLERIEEFETNNIDSIEFMQEIAKAAPHLSEQFGTKLLEIIFQRLNSMAQDKEDLMFIEYSTRLIEICVDDVIQGEPLFKSELAKYQGLEERIIRQRLVGEAIANH